MAARNCAARGRPSTPTSDLAAHLADEHGVTVMMTAGSADHLHRSLHTVAVEPLVAHDHAVLR